MDFAEMKQILEQYFLLLNGKRAMKATLKFDAHNTYDIAEAFKRVKTAYIVNLACANIGPLSNLTTGTNCTFQLPRTLPVTPVVGCCFYDFDGSVGGVADTLYIYDGANWHAH